MLITIRASAASSDFGGGIVRDVDVERIGQDHLPGSSRKCLQSAINSERQTVRGPRCAVVRDDRCYPCIGDTPAHVATPAEREGFAAHEDAPGRRAISPHREPRGAAAQLCDRWIIFLRARCSASNPSSRSDRARLIWMVWPSSL